MKDTFENVMDSFLLYYFHELFYAGVFFSVYVVNETLKRAKRLAS